jgi:hypothetical protein
LHAGHPFRLTARSISQRKDNKIHQPTKGQDVHIKNAARAVTAFMRAGLRRAVILLVACLALGAASVIAATAASASLPTSCGGDACFSQAAIHQATFWAWAQSLGFYGHFELQTPEHTVKNTDNEQWNVGVKRQITVPDDSGYYCITAWQLVGTNGYNKIGYACMTITA